MALISTELANHSANTAVRRVAGGLLILAVAIPCSTLLGWIFQEPVLRGLGNPRIAIVPLTSLIFLTFSVGGLLAHQGDQRTARALVGMAMVVLGLIVAEQAGAPLRLERLMFPNQVVALQVNNHGLPAGGGLAIMGVDGLAILLMIGRTDTQRTWAVLLASASVGLAILAGAIILISAHAAMTPWFLGKSAAAVVPNIALASGVVLSVLSADRADGGSDERRLFRQLAPAVVLLPVFPSLVALAIAGRDIVSFNRAQFSVVAANILIVALLLLLGLRGAARQGAAVRMREEQLRAILACVPDALVVTDDKGRPLDFSQSAAELWAVQPDIYERNMAEYLVGRERAQLAALLAQQREEFLITGEGMRSDGSRFPLELRGARFHGAHGEIRFTLFARDLSEKLAAERHVARLGAKLAQASRHNAMGELAADLAHELNQPLTAAINYLSTLGFMLAKHSEGGEASEIAVQARSQVSRAGEIIRRMRAFAEHREVAKCVESLMPMIDDAIQLVLAGTGANGVEIELAIKPENIQVFVDRIQFQQVAVNLLRNAVEAIRQSERGHGKILIAASQIEPDWVEIQFIDDGPGVPEHILGQLFERFTSTKAGAGMGIGLSISRRIIEAHGGTMSAVNGTVVGATFRLTLPAVPGSAGNRADRHSGMPYPDSLPGEGRGPVRRTGLGRSNLSDDIATGPRPSPGDQNY